MRSTLRNWATTLKRDTLAAWFAVRHRGTPPWVRWLGLLAVAYALSPIDLIPDFIPVIGYLDELLLLPAVLWLVIRFTPPHIFAACREQADAWLEAGHDRPRSKLGAIIVLLIWITVLWWLVSLFANSLAARTMPVQA